MPRRVSMRLAGLGALLALAFLLSPFEIMGRCIQRVGLCKLRSFVFSFRSEPPIIQPCGWRQLTRNKDGVYSSIVSSTMPSVRCAIVSFI